MLPLLIARTVSYTLHIHRTTTQDHDNRRCNSAASRWSNEKKAGFDSCQIRLDFPSQNVLFSWLQARGRELQTETELIRLILYRPSYSLLRRRSSLTDRFPWLCLRPLSLFCVLRLVARISVYLTSKTSLPRATFFIWRAGRGGGEQQRPTMGHISESYISNVFSFFPTDKARP